MGAGFRRTSEFSVCRRSLKGLMSAGSAWTAGCQSCCCHEYNGSVRDGATAVKSSVGRMAAYFNP